MLRSRPNRQQRPCESSDERQGGGGYNYHYGGYPASSPGGPMTSISSGADDDYYDGDAHKKKAAKHRGGAGLSLLSSVTKKGSGASFNRYGPSSKRSGGGDGIFFVVAIAFLILLLSGSTLYYRKMTYRAQDQLATLKMQSRHPREHIQQRQQQQERTQPNSNSNDESNKAATAAAALSSLKDKHSQLQNELSRSTTVNKNLETEIITATKVTEAIDNEMTSHNKQYDVLSKELSSKENEVRELRQQFVNSHPATLTTGGSANGIIPGGPGHTLNQKREMESMESLEDYENYVQRREDALWDKIDILTTKIGRDSKREALEWFGMDLLRQQVPENEIGFKVELDVEYPKYDPYMDHNNGNDNPELWPKARGTFIIEMAPLEMMPIAINLFLQQVHHKLWNGCAFVINAMHILQAGPHQYKGEQGKYDANSAVLKSNFEKSRLDKIPFQEYHAEFPHEMYTVGFAGRPGGPDFYINKVDNSVNHGPGGQGHHDIHEEADPCFGRVIGGIELIQEINHIPVNREKGNLLAVPVTILNGRVLSFRRVNVDTVDGDGGRRVKGGGEGVMSPSEGGGSFNMPA